MKCPQCEYADPEGRDWDKCPNCNFPETGECDDCGETNLVQGHNWTVSLPHLGEIEVPLCAECVEIRNSYN